MKPIPEEWVKHQIDTLLEVAKGLPERAPMRSACLVRAEYYMDLVKAWRESEEYKR